MSKPTSEDALERVESIQRSRFRLTARSRCFLTRVNAQGAKLHLERPHEFRLPFCVLEKAINPTQTLHPERFELLARFVDFPKDVRDHFAQLEP